MAGHGKGHCWAWDRVEAALAPGPATRKTLCPIVYGETTELNLRAMSLVLMRLTRAGRLVRVRYGWYALPGRTLGMRRFVRADLADALARAPLTMREIMWRFDVTETRAGVEVRALAADGHAVRRAVAPRWRWRGGRYAWWYWIA